MLKTKIVVKEEDMMIWVKLVPLVGEMTENQVSLLQSLCEGTCRSLNELLHYLYILIHLTIIFKTYNMG